MTTIIYLYEQKFRCWRKRLAGIYRFAKTQGWNVRTLEISEMKGDLGSMFDFWHAAGAIVEGGVAENARVRRVLRRKIPVVLCDFDVHRMGRSHFGVLHDSRETARTACAELLQKKCRIYGYVGFDVKRDWSRDRAEVFLEEMRRAGCEACVFDPTEGRRFRDATEFYATLEEWLGGLPRPCGIFAANDEMGEHILRAARNRGIAVPDEMVVIGVDNDELLCESTEPTLASVAPEFEESGHLAAGLLARRLANPKTPPCVLPFGGGQVVMRESMRKFRYRDFAALKAIEYIRLHACEGIGVTDVVSAMGTGRRSAELRFTRFTGHSILTEIEQVRFRRACELIRRPGAQLDTVHAEVGYGNARSLRALFYRLIGKSPAAWLASRPHRPSDVL